MLKHIILLLSLLGSLCAFDFKISSYNVENLFDLTYEKSEYKEYIPNTKSNWNHTTQRKKLNNIAQVIRDLNSDIIALQEIESKQALEALLALLPNYQHSAFIKNKYSSIGLAIISKFPILNNEKIAVRNSKVNRPIQKVTFLINHKKLIVFNNHWASKRQKESQRVNFALALQEHLKTLPLGTDYILLGDFNSNYNEFETLRLDKKLNDTLSFTGINHVLNTSLDKRLIQKESILHYKKRVHYNVWQEYPYEKRFSNIYRGHHTTPDNILLSPALFDDENFSYMNKSFEVFTAPYLFKNHHIYRWQMNQKNRTHLGLGYSDHLPISVKLSLRKYQKEPKTSLNSIDDLYTVHAITKPVVLKNVTVIYKQQNHAIIKTKNSRAIFLYHCATNLKLGFTYDLTINDIKEHYGLKEIINTEIVHKHSYNKMYKTLWRDSNKIDLHNVKFQNEVITGLNATYHKGYLHYGHQKIKLYAKDKTLLPNNGQKVTIISGHLGFFKNKAQIIIYKKSDIRAD